MLHGPQRDLFELSFSVPSECADRVQGGAADIGIIPVIELSRQKLEVVRGTGIACRGPVRSILLVSRRPFAAIRTLAVDTGSRTSVALARIILSQQHGVDPRLMPMAPDLGPMLEAADAALIIGDPALRLDPASLPYQTLDLGEEWTRMTGLPMVFAVWAGRGVKPGMEEAFLGSCRFGLERISEIVAQEAGPRGIPASLSRRYLTEHIAFELGDREYEGLDLFLRHASKLDTLVTSGSGRL